MAYDAIMRGHPDQMTFLEHLEELRKRLLRILIAAGIGTAIAFYFSKQLVGLILLPGGGSFVYIKPAEAFTVYLAASFLAGLVLASPYIFYELWRFVSPGLLVKERRYAFPFILATTVCFATGVVFGYLLLFPAMRFFRSFETTALLPHFSYGPYEFPPAGIFQAVKTPSLMAQWTIGSYASLALRLVLATGLVFEAPVVVFFLARLGIISHKTLLAKWRFIVIGIFVLAAILTPGPDMFTQSLLAIPLVVLYVISIAVAYFAYPRTRRAEDVAFWKDDKPAGGDTPYAG